ILEDVGAIRSYRRVRDPIHEDLELFGRLVKNAGHVGPPSQSQVIAGHSKRAVRARELEPIVHGATSPEQAIVGNVEAQAAVIDGQGICGGIPADVVPFRDYWVDIAPRLAVGIELDPSL